MSTELRIVIADDERPARGFLIAMLKACPNVTVVGEAADGSEALRVIQETRPDLLLLDMQMPGMDGAGLLTQLRETQNAPLVAFVTAHDDYAVRAFDVGAVDYLSKPVTQARLEEALERARERLPEVAASVAGLAGVEDEPADRSLGRIPVKHRGEIILLPVNRVASIVAERELLHLTTDRGERFTITYRLKDLEGRLGPTRFVRLSRGALVNVGCITRVVPQPGGLHTVHLQNGQSLSMSRIQSRVLRNGLLRL